MTDAGGPNLVASVRARLRTLAVDGGWLAR